MTTSRLLIVTRNGKAIFHASLDGFGAAFAKSRRDCGANSRVP